MALKDKLALLPDKPGCYLMKDRAGSILYVGKAKVLKNRVRSYFHGVHDYKTTKLVSHIADFEFIVTSSEKESLLLESNLIKKHRPPYNILLMDDSSYPYIMVTSDPDFQVRLTRKVKDRKQTYFGPYPSASTAGLMVQLINQLFPIRKCQTLPKRACLYYHMKQCVAPCIHELDQKQMKHYRQQILRFLKGDSQEVVKKLKGMMDEAVEQLRFERAQEIHEQIQAIEYVSERQTIELKDRKDRDVFAYYEDKGYLSIAAFIIRDGKVLERALSVSPVYEQASEAFLSYLLQYYQQHVIPQELILPEAIEQLDQALDCQILVPQRGLKKRLIDLVIENAKTAHEQKFALMNRQDLSRQQANEQLDQVFGHPISTVELVDNSHIQGAHNVSGVVVFRDGLPDKRLYRHYKLDTYVSDVDSMKEVLYRRYFKVLTEQGSLPDLLLVDGGLAQINAAKSIKESLHLDLRLAGLVKDDRHTTAGLMLENGETVEIEKDSELFFLLTRMQDEVHRFAISYHRKTRNKAMVHSILDDIEGVGPKRKQLLMRHFKSVKKMKEASLEQLQEVVGPSVGLQIYEALKEKPE